MGGEETEIGDGDDDRAARGGELRAVRHLPHLRAPSAPHRGLEPLGEGRRPVPRRAGRRARDRLLSSSSRARDWTAASDVHGDAARAAGRSPFRPERADALIGIETPPERQYAMLERLGFDRRDGEVVVADLARARRDARGRRDRGDRPLPPRGRPVHAARPPRDVRPADARAAAPPPGRGRARRPRLRRDLHAEPAPRRRHDLEASRADLGRADRAAHLAPAEPRRGRAPQRRRGRSRRSRCSRSRASTCRRRRPARRAASASPGSPRAASCTSRASSRRSTRALKAEPGLRARASTRCSIPGKTARTPARASSASSIRASSRASGARSSSTWPSSSRAQPSRSPTAT